MNNAWSKLWDGPPYVEIEGHLQYKEKHNQKGAMKPVKLNTSKLRNTIHAESLVQEMDNALAQSSEDNDTPCWTSFQKVVYDTAKASLGNHEKKHQDWFDPNDQILRDLMAKRDQAHQRVVADQKHPICCPSLQRCMQNTTEIYTSSKV